MSDEPKRDWEETTVVELAARKKIETTKANESKQKEAPVLPETK